MEKKEIVIKKKVNLFLSKLQWLNEAKQSLLFGFSDYTFKDFKKKKMIGKEGVSVFLMMAILLGNEENSEYQSELYDFILHYESDGHNMLQVIDESNLTSKSFKEMMMIFLLAYEEDVLMSFIV
jgi:hypothetical protein